MNTNGKNKMTDYFASMIRAVFVCVLLAFAATTVTAIDIVADPAAAEAAISKHECSARGQPPCPVRYKGPVCDSGLGKLRGLCRPCGGARQEYCPKSKKGPQCNKGLMKISGKCYASCGGRNEIACKKSKKGYPCAGRYAPDSRKICRPCGGTNQKACRAGKSGGACNIGTTKSKGICRACGNRGQEACPKLAKGFPCKGKLEPNSSNICAPCGANGLKACRAFKKGKQCDAGTMKVGSRCFTCGGKDQPACIKITGGLKCNAWLTPNSERKCTSCGLHGKKPCPVTKAGKRCAPDTKKIGRTCQRCGGPNQTACPKLATGYPCRGNYKPDGNNICKPCGGAGEPSCRVFKAGRQCAEWTTSRNGRCVGCGSENQKACRITDKGKPCKPYLKRKLNGMCVLTKEGVMRKAAMAQLSKDSAVIVPMLTKGSSMSQDTAMRSNIRSGASSASEGDSPPRSDNVVGDRPKISCPVGTNTWAIGVGVEAGFLLNFEGEAGMAFNCTGNRDDTKDAKWYFSKSVNFRLGGGAGGGFTLSFWKDDVSDLRGKSHGYVIDVIEAVQNMTGMSKEVQAVMSGDVKKLKDALGEFAPEVTVGIWFQRRDEDGEGWMKDNDVGRFLGYTITLSKAAGWDAGGAYIRATTEQICTVDMKCTEGTWAGKFGGRNGTIYVDGQTKTRIKASINGETPKTYARVTKAGRKYRAGSSGPEIRYRHNYTELQYRSGTSGGWSKLTLAREPTLAGVYSLNRGAGNIASLVVDNVKNKGFHARLNNGERTRFTRKRGRTRTYTGGPGGDVTITFRDNYRKVKYQPRDGVGYDLTRGTADDIVGDADGMNHEQFRGEWTMRVPGRNVTEEITRTDDARIWVKRTPNGAERPYNRTGENEYTSRAGGKFRFVSPTRGIWVSEDGKTVFQLQKK